MERHHRKIVWHEKFRVLDEILAQSADQDAKARVIKCHTHPDHVFRAHILFCKRQNFRHSKSQN